LTHLRVLALGLGVCVAVAMIACGNGNPNPTGTGPGGGTCPGSAKATGLGTVAMTIAATDALVFDPATSTAQVGKVIEFKNTGSIAHTVTFLDSNDGCLTDDTLNPGATWDVMFKAPGTYHYLCTIHAPNMKGQITLTGSASTPSSSASASSGGTPVALATPTTSASP
jgi:plastocyanin